MQVATILLAIIMPILGCALNATLNIKIKFAADAAQAKRERNLILLRVVAWVVNLYCAGNILWLLIVPPLSKSSLFGMLVCSFSLFSSFVFSLFDLIANNQARIVDTQTRHINLTEKHIAATDAITERTMQQINSLTNLVAQTKNPDSNPKDEQTPRLGK